jgi:hypothetical protein
MSAEPVARASSCARPMLAGDVRRTAKALLAAGADGRPRRPRRVTPRSERPRSLARCASCCAPATPIPPPHMSRRRSPPARNWVWRRSIFPLRPLPLASAGNVLNAISRGSGRRVIVEHRPTTSVGDVPRSPGSASSPRASGRLMRQGRRLVDGWVAAGGEVGGRERGVVVGCDADGVDDFLVRGQPVVYG